MNQDKHKNQLINVFFDNNSQSYYGDIIINCNIINNNINIIKRWNYFSGFPNSPNCNTTSSKSGKNNKSSLSKSNLNSNLNNINFSKKTHELMLKIEGSRSKIDKDNNHQSQIR